MFRRISYLTAALVIAGAVMFSDQIKEALSGVPVIGEWFNKK